MRRQYQAAADAGDVNLDDLLIMHAFARASDAVRRRVVHGFCAEECCPADHPLVVCAKHTATFCQLHDPAAAALSAAELLSAAVAFSLNAFGYLADGTTGGATTVYWAASKFTHRCLCPNAVFHGDAGRLSFRAARAVAPGEVLTISYLGPWAHCLAPLRRKTLQATKGFDCLCTDCLGADVMRPLPCPACVPRSAATGLLLAPPKRSGAQVPCMLRSPPPTSDHPTATAAAAAATAAAATADAATADAAAIAAAIAAATATTTTDAGDARIAPPIRHAFAERATRRRHGRLLRTVPR